MYQIKETTKAVRDSEAGIEKMAIGRHLNDRGHVITRQKDTRTGNMEENRDYLNFDECKQHLFTALVYYTDVTDRIQFRIAVVMYRCLHGIAPEYLTELYTPASTPRHGTLFDPPEVISSWCCQSDCPSIVDALLV